MSRHLRHAVICALGFLLISCGGGSGENRDVRPISNDADTSSFRLDPTARFNRPGDTVTDSRGNLYVMDRGNRNIRRVAASGRVSTLSGNFDERSSIAIDAEGRLIVLSGTELFRVDPEGNRSLIKAYVQVPGSYTPLRVAIDSQGDIYVLIAYRQIYRVQRIDADLAEANIYYVETFGAVTGMASDAAGNIALGFVSPTGESYVEYVPVSERTGADLHSPGIAVLPVDSAFISYGQLAFDATGHLYAAGGELAEADRSDELHFASIRIARFSFSGGMTEIFNGFPDGGATPRQVNSGARLNIGLAIDADENIYFSDPFDHAVYRIAVEGRRDLYAGLAGEPGSSD